MAKDAENGKQELEKRLTNVRAALEDQVNRVKDSVPDFEKFIAEYKREGQRVVDELKTDETVKKILEF